MQSSDPTDSADRATAVRTESKDIVRLTDGDLIARTEGFSRDERYTTLDILLHLAEIERRRLWRTLEYRSMFDYCVRRLRYSEGAAGRRIRTAMLIARHPVVYERIKVGRLSLCVAAKIARTVLDDGRVDLIDMVEGKRFDQVDAILATHRNPSRPVRESIRLLCVERRLPADQATKADSPGDTPSGEPAPEPKDAAESPRNAPRDAAGREPTTVERVFKFQFGIDAKTMAKFSRVQSIAASREGRHVDLTELFGVLCDAYLDRHDPVRIAKRRELNRDKRKIAGESPERVTGADAADTGRRIKHRRHIPRAVRDRVYLRDDGRCTFVDQGGERCNASSGLHIDHVQPFGLGGSNDESNLRLLCPTHNVLMA